MKNNRDMERCLKAAYDGIAKGAPLCRQIEGNVKGRRGMDAVLERGEQEYRGYILLPGTENRPCFVGDPPLWKENPVGDEEYVWGLNRHSQWKDYILCYCATGERKFTYREGADRRLFKSATMHNTLILGEREPYDYVSRWLFRNEKNGCICNVTEEDGFLAAWAIHTSYFPTIHSRLLILMREGFLVVWDRLEHYRGQKVDIWFHLDSLHVKQEGDMVYTDEEVSLAIRTAGHLKCELCEGRLSERIDSDRPSVRVRFTDEGQASVGRDYLTILAPFRKARPEISDIAVDREQGTAVFRYNGKGYRISWKDDMCRVEDENRPQDTENIPEGK